jgi:hypothetical protein
MTWSQRLLTASVLLLILGGCQSAPTQEATSPASTTLPVQPTVTRRTLATAAPTSAPLSTPMLEPSVPPGFEPVSIAPLPHFISSYQHSLQLDFTGVAGTTPITQSAVLTQDVTRDPDAERLTMISSGSGGAPADEVNILRVGDQIWIQEGDGWVEGAAGQALPNAPLNIEALVAQIANWELVDATSIVADQPASHYRFSEANLRDHGLGLGTIEAAAGEAWVAQDGGYLLKLMLHVQGGALMMANPDPAIQGQTLILYTLTSINAPLVIETPTP